MELELSTIIDSFCLKVWQHLDGRPVVKQAEGIAFDFRD